jgi:hypothetical protein
MTPEERFTRIENLLHTVTESQVQNGLQIEKNTVSIRDVNVNIRDVNASIRDLTAVVGSLTDVVVLSTERHDREIAEIRELHKDIDTKLNALVAEVDRIIRKDKGQ